MATIVQCNCGAEYRRTEEKFLAPHTGDAICTVCGAALESAGTFPASRAKRACELFTYELTPHLRHIRVGSALRLGPVSTRLCHAASPQFQTNPIP